MSRSPAALLAALVLLAGGCSAPEAPRTEAPRAEPAAPTSGAAPTPDAGPSLSERPATSPTRARGPLPPVRHRPSLPALMRQRPDSGRPRITTTEYATDRYTRHQVLYRSGDIDVSGVLIRPRGRGPFPAVVLNHGYIEPSVYQPGQGLAREQDALARAGFVVLHTDYRGHAASDPAGEAERSARIGYAADAINAVAALRALPYVDDDRLAMLGRSMGGGVTMNALVAQPGLVDAAVIYASVSSEIVENIEHFTDPGEGKPLYERFGRPRQRPGFYRQLSPRTYFDRITEPVLVHHGRLDDTCPPRWARQTQRLMRREGVDSRLVWYAGEGHTFDARWRQSMDRTIGFLRRELGRG
ncbi:alpha/beta hydrolase family protein [Nocardioides coralli]|uniref:alpha/beta hydrolase family protein n=1 Tax=Nocardioides coralli TaxID=2872154 RepID=UPI001CA3DF39|nr:alpha/beta fold hydrolase [Nocardioides coralli]QZY28699.1 alpha/beta fold hydrolase [Nocardioides coralli]